MVHYKASEISHHIGYPLAQVGRQSSVHYDWRPGPKTVVQYDPKLYTNLLLVYIVEETDFTCTRSLCSYPSGRGSSAQYTPDPEHVGKGHARDKDRAKICAARVKNHHAARAVLRARRSDARTHMYVYELRLKAVYNDDTS